MAFINCCRISKISFPQKTLPPAPPPCFLLHLFHPKLPLIGSFLSRLTSTGSLVKSLCLVSRWGFPGETLPAGCFQLMTSADGGWLDAILQETRDSGIFWHGKNLTGQHHQQSMTLALVTNNFQISTRWDCNHKDGILMGITSKDWQKIIN